MWIKNCGHPIIFQKIVNLATRNYYLTAGRLTDLQWDKLCVVREWFPIVQWTINISLCPRFFDLHCNYHNRLGIFLLILLVFCVTTFITTDYLFGSPSLIVWWFLGWRFLLWFWFLLWYIFIRLWIRTLFRFRLFGLWTSYKGNYW